MATRSGPIAVIGVVAGAAALTALGAYWLAGPPAAEPGSGAPEPVPVPRPVERPGAEQAPPRTGAPDADGQRIGDAIFRGRLLAGDGRPVDGAQVEATTASPAGAGAPRLARTGPDGGFRIAIPGPVTLRTARFAPTATTAGFAVTLGKGLAAGEVFQRDFYVPAAAELTATVVDLAGAPVAGLDVLVFSGTAPPATEWDRPPIRELVSSAAGTVSFPAPGEECLALARGPEHVPVAANEQHRLLQRESGSMRLVVAPAAAWSARIVAPDGRPVAGAEITVQPAWSLEAEPLSLPPGSGARLPPGSAARSDPGGTFTLTLAAGLGYRVVVRSAGFATYDGTVRGGSAPPTLELEAGVPLYGTVKGTDGSPIPGARVEVRGTNRRTATTDAAGSYELAAMSRKGEDTLSVQAVGFVPKAVRIDHDRTSLERLDLSLTPSRTASGLVVDHRGDPAGGVAVILAYRNAAPRRSRDAPGGDSRPVPVRPEVPDQDGTGVRDVRNQHATRTDAGGRFEIRNLPPGEHEVVLAFGPEGRVRVTERITTEAETRIQLPDPDRVGSVLFGRVTDAAAKTSVPVFSILAQRVRGSLRSGSRKRFDHDDGEYRLVGLPVGEVELLVEAPGYATRRVVDLHLGPGIRRLDIALHPSRRVRFRLEERTRAPGGVLLRFFDADGSPVLVDSAAGTGVAAVRLDHGEPITVAGLPACSVKIEVELQPNGKEAVQFADLQSVDGIVEILVPR